MPFMYRILIAAGILALDGALFFLPLCAIFLAYVLLVNPPWFRDFLNGLDRISGDTGEMNGERNSFWETKPYQMLSAREWEALCDGCGRCCLEKLENKKTGKVYFTVVACHLLDLTTCRCTIYTTRSQKMPDCLQLTPQNLFGKWLPSTCAYRLLREGKKLPDWHPLISGDPDSVHTAGISIRNFAVSGEGVHPDQLEDFIFRNGKL